MDAPPSPPRAWQPLTPGGVARFAHDRFGRLLLAQLLVATLAAASVALFVRTAWMPVVESALPRLPTNAVIQFQRLHWPSEPGGVLAENAFLCITANPTGTKTLGSTADLRLEAESTRIRLSSLFGYIDVPYPRGYQIALHPDALLPWWGARRPFLLAGVFLGTLLLLFLSWFVLATLGAIPVRLLALFADRNLSLPGAWRLAAAALLPGALFLAAAITGYTLHRVNLRDLLLAFAFHFLCGLVYLVASPFRLPDAPDATPQQGNPFHHPPQSPAPPPSDNPFRPA